MRLTYNRIYNGDEKPAGDMWGPNAAQFSMINNWDESWGEGKINWEPVEDDSDFRDNCNDPIAQGCGCLMASTGILLVAIAIAILAWATVQLRVDEHGQPYYQRNHAEQASDP